MQKYIDIQKTTYEIAFREIVSQKKLNHWMWYMFPQIHSLGKSNISKYYAIKNINECIDYLNNKYLYENIYNICLELLKHDIYNPIVIFGEIDSKKLQSSMTLFDYTIENSRNLLDKKIVNIFKKVLDKYYYGQRDRLTLEILEGTK